MTLSPLRIRTPRPVATRDASVSDLLNANQILYMVGRSSDVDLGWIDRWLSHQDRDFDPSTYALHMLFNAGLELRDITPHDLDQALDIQQGYYYWRALFPPPIASSGPAEEDYHLWHRSALQQRQVRHDFSHRIHTSRRAATPADIRQLISENWLVIVREIKGDWGINSIFYSTSRYGFHTYSPLRGVRIVDDKLLSRYDTPVLQAWRLPSTSR